MSTLTAVQTQAAAAFRAIKALIVCYVGVSVLALAAIVARRNDSADVNSAVWTRGIIVVITGLLLLSLAVRAARGSRAAYRRLRIISLITVLAIAAIVTMPGGFPLWMKVEQSLCGLLMIGVAGLANGSRLRALLVAR
jgi:hypothetical protein